MSFQRRLNNTSIKVKHMLVRYILSWLPLAVIAVANGILRQSTYGHFVVGHPWARLFADYDLLSGRVWSVFLLWILFMPWLFYRFG
jgi:hypothetical protein